MIIVRKQGSTGVRVPAEVLEKGDAAVAAFVDAAPGEVCPELEAIDSTLAATTPPAPAAPAPSAARSSGRQSPKEG